MSEGSVLVTGGAGYIGSHAAKALHQAGHRVVVFDNLVAGHREAVKYGELVVGDITDVDAVRSAIRYFNAAGADPDGEFGEDHSPEIHLIPRAIHAATGGPGLQVFGDDYPTPDGTCLRDYVHVTDLADAHVRALDAAIETGRSGAYNLGTGHPHSVREVIDTVERVTGRTVPWTLAPRRPAIPRCSTRRRRR